MTATPVIGTTFFGLDISGLGEGLKSIRRKISRSTLLIEFGSRMLQIAEARQRSHGIEIRHFSRIVLPEEALERSIPADPDVMAQLLRDFCKEKGIISHRAAVVLPPELAFQRLVQLPVGLSVQEARKYLLDPRNGLSLPFPIAQTDFDLVPLDSFDPMSTKPGSSAFQLSAIPSSLVEPVLTMLDRSDFDLQTLELGSFSALRCIQDSLQLLGASGVCLLLDFLPDATLLHFVGTDGLIESERLPSVREFPRYELSELEREQILQGSQSLEQATIASDRYLPLSEMDLRAFMKDLECALSNFLKRYSGSTLIQVVVTGEGSAHPDLPALLQNHLNCSVKQVRPLLTKGLREWELDEPLLQASLTRLVGLGLGLLGTEQAIEQPDSTSGPHDCDQKSLLSESTVPESGGSNFATLLNSSSLIDSSQALLAVDEDASPTLIELDVSEGEVEDEESEWPSLNLAASESVLEDAEEIGGEDEIEPVRVEVSQGEVDDEESEWPSLNLAANESVLEDAEEIGGEGEIEPVRADVSEGDVEGEESEWPSLNLAANESVLEDARVVDGAGEIEPVRVDVSEGEVEGEESEWPSLNLEGTQKHQSSESAAEKSTFENSVIPGLPIAKAQPAQLNPISESTRRSGLTDFDVDESPLGELRFKD